MGYNNNSSLGVALLKRGPEKKPFEPEQDYHKIDEMPA
jgi:hypothetical protein